MYEFEGKLLSAHIYKTFYVGLMVTTKEKKKPTVDTHKIKRKEWKHTTPKKKKITKTAREKERNKGTFKKIDTSTLIVMDDKELSDCHEAQGQKELEKNEWGLRQFGNKIAWLNNEQKHCLVAGFLYLTIISSHVWVLYSQYSLSLHCQMTQN